MVVESCPHVDALKSLSSTSTGDDVAALLFLFYSYVVERRHNAMTDKVIEQVTKAAETERELNEFLSHEV